MPAPPILAPIADQPLSVVLLVRDPTHVPAVLPGWLAFLDARGKDDELLLVTDTPMSQTHPQLRVISLDAPASDGVMLRAGLEAASRPLLAYALCDPVYRPEMLADFLSRNLEMEDDHGKIHKVNEIDHVHLMTGFRAGVRVPLGLRITGWLWWLFCIVVFSYSPRPLPGWLGLRRRWAWWLSRVLFGVRHHDPACPFRLMRRDILARIPLQSKGPFAHVELLAKANFLGCLMGDEIPLDVRPPRYQGDAASFFADGRRVFNKPNFGPAVLPTPGAPPCPSPP